MYGHRLQAWAQRLKRHPLVLVQVAELDVVAVLQREVPEAFEGPHGVAFRSCGPFAHDELLDAQGYQEVQRGAHRLDRGRGQLVRVGHHVGLDEYRAIGRYVHVIPDEFQGVPYCLVAVTAPGKTDSWQSLFLPLDRAREPVDGMC